ncbi:MAG: hypothetical protein KDE05_08005 [Parvularculaceae bacterium]|nr:hypothetical protein [Parvularculaceae bacterium]
MRRLLVAFALFILAACARETAPTAPVFHEEGYPASLSAWNLMAAANGVLTLSPGVDPYDLATPLFTDYALKLRTVTLPGGTSGVYRDKDAFDFPVGTIISKTFYYPTANDGDAGGAWTGDVAIGPAPTVEGGAMPLQGLRLIETRLLVHRVEGWVAIPYRWNDEQTDAALHRTGATIPMTLHRPDGREEAFAYVMPNQNQCAGCHATNNTTRKISPIGLKARHLNKPSTFAAGFNQLDYWIMTGKLTGVPEDAQAAPGNADWTDESASLDARARAYLDVNCSHCHSDVGPADTSGLDLRPSVAFGPHYGACKTPVAAGGGSGGRPFDIVPGDPDASIFIYRMQTTKPGDMMPELGRSTTHEEGVALIAEWIRTMEGGCG